MSLPRVERSAGQSVRHRRAVGRRQDQPDARVARARTRYPPFGVLHDATAAAGRAGRRRLPLRLGRMRFAALKDANEFLEYAHVHGNWYATSATWLKSQVRAGQDVLLEIDWQGAAQVRTLIPESVHIFILPPSLESLEERLVRAGQDDASDHRSPA